MSYNATLTINSIDIKQKNSQHPLIIQGGMGVGVSNWKLARAVSLTGQLGVVSGTMIDTVMIRRLQDGDPEGTTRQAIAHFPNQEIAQEIINQYYIERGRKANQPYKLLPLPSEVNNPWRDKIATVAGFVEVFLAKEGHNGKVGMNLLTKGQFVNLTILYGAMLAGVDYILMGAGIPKEIPAVLDQLALHKLVKLKLDVEETKDFPNPDIWINFDPSVIIADVSISLNRPYFFPIIASHSLATILTRKASGRVDGFIVEGSVAGGHNAPPRGGIILDENGEPQYGTRDEVDLKAMRSLGLPFWLAGGMANPESLESALQQGASGIQVGTLFALCEESGFTPQIKETVIKAILEDTLEVFTDPDASPTGFPFKVISVEGSLSEQAVYQARPRRCGLGYLRKAYRLEDGKIEFRCPGEPTEKFLKHGGLLEKNINCKCLCNSLLAAIGLPQVSKDGSIEPPLITGSSKARQLKSFLAALPHQSFKAVNAVEYLLTNILNYSVAQVSCL